MKLFAEENMVGFATKQQKENLIATLIGVAIMLLTIL